MKITIAGVLISLLLFNLSSCNSDKKYPDKLKSSLSKSDSLVKKNSSTKQYATGRDRSISNEEIIKKYEADSSFVGDDYAGEFIEIGNFLGKTRKHTVLNFKDTLFIYEKINNQWQRQFAESTPISGTLYHECCRMEDFNFDGLPDISMITGASNGCSAIHYYLLLQKSNKNGFTNINSFEDLGDPKRFPKEKVIRSRIASCGCGCFTIYEHKWNGDSLELVKTSDISFRGGKMNTQFEIYRKGKIIKKYEKQLTPKQEDSLFENYVY